MTRLPRARALASASALVSLMLLAAGPARAAQFRITVSPDTLRADDTGLWHFELWLSNPGDHGLYPDSLVLDWLSDAPAAPGSPASGTHDLTHLARSMQPAGAGDSTGTTINLPALMDRGQLVVRMRCKTAKGQASGARHELRVAGNALSERFPSQQLTVSDRATELLLVPASPDAEPAAGVVVLPPEGVGARALLRWALTLHDRGYALAIVSPPGAGGSSGPADMAGPASVAAAREALARLAALPGSDARRLLLWGEGLGATTALLAAAGRTELAGVVSLNATFDPWAEYRLMDSRTRDAYVTAAGRDSAAWRARSPLAVADAIPAPVLVLHTDAAGPAGSAVAFVERRSAAGLPAESRVHTSDGASVRRQDAVRLATDFLARRARVSGP